MRREIVSKASLQPLDYASNNTFYYKNSFIFHYNLFDKIYRSLCDLSLTSNNLASLPEEIGDLTQLTVLRVDDNRLTSLPDSIGRLTNLEELQAGQNRLLKLPTSIGLLRKLETLMLNENQLDDLPAELGSCQRLTVLSLRKNRLEHLPPEMGHLSRLRVINLSCNRLLHLPVSFLKLPSLSALWLSEAQTKPVVPLQTDTDSSTGHKVLTCFLLPQSTDAAEVEEQQQAPSDSPKVFAARSPTHIKFAFDGETDHRAGKLMRNPTPYPKELKALAKHAQHMQQHHPVSSPTSRNSVELTPSSSTSDGLLKKEPVSPKKQPEPVAPPVQSPTLASSIEPPVVLTTNEVAQPNDTVDEEPVIERQHHQVEIAPEPPSESLPPAASFTTTSPLPSPNKRYASVENLLANPEPESPKQNGVPAELSPRLSDVEIKEARVLRPLMSEEPEPPQKVKNLDTVVDRSSQLDLTVVDSKQQQQQPPPYHVAAAYSKRAAEFNHAASLPRTQSTESGFTVEGEKRDNSPSRDSGRGPSIEPLEDNPVTKRPLEIPLNDNALEKATPLALKRATYIIDRSLSPTNGITAEESADLQSVAALRQAAREVFLASPRESPLPSHKQSVWDAPIHSSNGPSTLSAAHVVGLPPAGSVTSENTVQQPKIQGRLPPPKYHVTSNGFRDVPAELKSPPPSTASSRIPLSSHNRLPSGLPRQSSNVSSSTDGSAISKATPILPPKIRDPSPPPPTLLPKLSTSRIPPPQVHTPTAAPLTPLSTKTTFSPLPVHSARLVTPITPTTPNNNDLDANQSNKTTSSTQLGTRIPLPKYSTASEVSKAGPSPVSRIPTRLPTPTSTGSSITKAKLSTDLTGSPSLAAYTPRIQ